MQINIQAACPQRGLPRHRLKYCKLLSKLLAVTEWVHCCRTCSIEAYFESFESKLNSDFSDEREMILKQNLIEAYFESFESKLNSDFSDEREMILKQNLDILVPKYIGTISFALHFLEQIQRMICLWYRSRFRHKADYRNFTPSSLFSRDQQTAISSLLRMEAFMPKT